MSSYCTVYVTTGTLHGIMIDSFSLKEVARHEDGEVIASPKKGLSGGEVAGIVIGVLIVVSVISVLVIYLVRIRIRYGEDSDAIIRTSI